jgi:NAD(P)-dependent dehydrogenase (short-subunit alcohol dehydrogenase family)
MSAYPSIVGRTVVVTGGSRGLGRVMVLGLARAGTRVAIVARGPSRQLDETLAHAASFVARWKVVTALGDLRDHSACEKIVS